jgi:hypothetical protein
MIVDSTSFDEVFLFNVGLVLLLMVQAVRIYRQGQR